MTRRESISARAFGHALRYARRGLHVLPVRQRGKEPLVTHGVHDASGEPDVIRDWWARWPTANVAIAVPVDWFVVDVDPRNGGDAELTRLQGQHGALPATVTARTGSGGEHRLFARPAGVRLRGKLGRGIDLLGVGRYFLAAPSIHPCGQPYRWTSPRGAPIAEPPRWLVELATVREPLAPAVPVALLGSSRVARARAYLAHVPPAISGAGGHAHTFVTAQRLVRGFGLDEATAFALLRIWNRTCQPPWSTWELARKVKQAASVGRMPMGAKLVEEPDF
ncbi:MAG: bifunctional DNA primase/polymerase [Polyangiaceae bacterium]